MQEATLERRFGFWTAVFLVVASMVGSGVLTSTGFLLQRIPNLDVVAWLWLLGGLVALCGALTMAEMATAFPMVGGDYVYVREAFGDRLGFTYGCAMVILGFAAPIALVAYTLAAFVWPFWINALGENHFLASREDLFCIFLSCILIVSFTILHLRGHNESARTQGITTLFKIFIFLVFVIAGLASPVGNWNHFNTTFETPSLTALGSNLVLIMYCYTGWNGAVYIAGEIKNPKKNLTWALISGTILVIVLYLLLHLLYGYAIRPNQVNQLNENQIAMYAETVNQKLFSTPMAKTFSALIALGIFASLSSFIMAGPRIIFAMSKDGLLPSWLYKTSPKTKLPSSAIWAQTAISLILLFSGSFQFILDFAGYGLGVISLMIVLPIFFFRRRIDYKPSFKVPLYPLLPAVFLLVNVMMLLSGAFEAPIPVATSLVTISLPFIVYPIYRSRMTTT